MGRGWMGPPDITRNVLDSNPKARYQINVFQSARNIGFSVRVVKTHEEGREIFGVIFEE